MDDQISFTDEEEQSCSLRFLDVFKKRMETTCLRTSVLRKGKHTARVLKYRSNYPDNAKAAVVRALIWRI